jgi:polyprenyl P-hydroxybenzoate/phenylacrylic acid decarboxylase-like protein
MGKADLSRPDRIVVGITGASMPQLGIRLLEVLRHTPVETHLVISQGARRTISLECRDRTIDDVQSLADVVHQSNDLAASIASGSFLTRGMAIVPCSMNTVSKVAYSLGSDLVTRAADVTLKEFRPLVLMPRESPLHVGHLRSLTRAAEIGARIIPPVLGSYYDPKSIDDIVDHLVGRVLDQFGFEHDLVRRWAGPDKAGRQ